MDKSKNKFEKVIISFVLMNIFEEFFYEYNRVIIYLFYEYK